MKENVVQYGGDVCGSRSVNFSESLAALMRTV